MSPRAVPLGHTSTGGVMSGVGDKVGDAVGDNVGDVVGGGLALAWWTAANTPSTRMNRVAPMVIHVTLGHLQAAQWRIWIMELWVRHRPVTRHANASVVIRQADSKYTEEGGVA